MPSVSKVCHFYFRDNFGDSGPIFKKYSLFNSETSAEEAGIETISYLLPHYLAKPSSSLQKPELNGLKKLCHLRAE